MTARRLTARAVAGMAALCLLGTLPQLSAVMPGATTAQAKKGVKAVPPGQAKKLVKAVEPLKVEAPRTAVVEEVAKTGKPAKANGNGKGPKKLSPPQAATPSSPPVAAQAPVPATPPATPLAQAPAQGTAPPSTKAPGGNREGAKRRDRTRDTRSEPSPATRSTTAGAGGTGAFGASTGGGAAAPAAPRDRGSERADAQDEGSPVARTVTRTVRDIVEVVPDSMKLALAALAALSLVLAGIYLVSFVRARSLARQRGELLREVGLLQSALLPPIPDRLGALMASVAYRPADGPGAGGDFYDALPLSGGRAGFILGDVSGHGHGALERTAFMRYTLRAYLEAGLEPRAALQVAGRVIGESLRGDFATVLLAVHDPRSGSLTYASAGHPAPIIVGGQPFEPVNAVSSPPIGVGERTGLRQTTVPLMPGSVACLYTDGLIEARTGDGLLGRERLEGMLAELGREATASALIERVASEASATPDDMATCVLSPTAGVTTGGFRTEQIELSVEECEGPLPGRFLEACGVTGEARESVEREAYSVATGSGGAVLSVTFGGRRTVEVLPHNVESIEAASRRAAARV